MQTLILLLSTVVTLQQQLVNAIVSERNPKKGVALAGAQACSALEPHTDSSWWYSWSTSDGFSGKWSFCNDDAQTPSPSDTARANGMEFVPMFWSSVPDPASLDADIIANMQAASHVMGFNEPERTDQANLSPLEAATKWEDVVAIANNYDLKIVGPCLTKDAFAWYDEWLTECDTLYPGVGCHHDAVCIHMYMQPAPCDTSKSWECIGSESNPYHAKYHLDRWYNDYGNKPIWVTEYGCYPWTAAGCDAEKHEAIMDQMTSLFESPEYTDKIERYNWFTMYASDEGFGPGALNVPNWEHLGDGVGCVNREWLANVYPTFSWGIHEINECVALALNNANCHTPLAISMDNDNCYCSLDACDTVVSTWGGMKTFKELTDQPTGVSALSLSGEQYNSFGMVLTMATSEPTPFPTSLSPTKAPTQAPTIDAHLDGVCSDNGNPCSISDMSGCECADARRILKGTSESNKVKVSNLRVLAKKTPNPTSPATSPPTTSPTTPAPVECTCLIPTPEPSSSPSPPVTTKSPTSCECSQYLERNTCKVGCGGSDFSVCEWKGSGGNKSCLPVPF